MDKRLYTEACIRGLRPGARLVLGEQALATPAALDLAFLRGIEVCYGAPEDHSTPRHQDHPLQSLLEQDGTYVVEVRGGVPSVHRLSQGASQSLELPGANS